VLGYIAQLVPPPPSLFPQERAALHHIMHIPTNSFELSVFSNLDQLGCKPFKSIRTFCQASMIRAAHKTIKGWLAQWNALRALAGELLPLGPASSGALCSPMWDSAPFVSHLADAYNGTGTFASAKHACDSIRNGEGPVGFLPDRGPSRKPNRMSLQANAHNALHNLNGAYCFYLLLHRRCVPLGISNFAVIARRDVAAAFEVAKKVSHGIAIAWLKTITNAWCTTYRMHEEKKLKCIFGCQEPDRIDHYLCCPNLWSLIDGAFGGNLPACVFARLNYSVPSERNLCLIAAAFEMYHALKIGHRSLVDEAVATRRFAHVHAQAKILARDHGNSFRSREQNCIDTHNRMPPDDFPIPHECGSSASTFSDVSA
jgi:hypothetical protein